MSKQTTRRAVLAGACVVPALSLPVLAAEHDPPLATAARQPGKLGRLIQQWQSAHDDCDKLCDENTRTLEAAEAALPPPDASITKADPIMARVFKWDFGTLRGVPHPDLIANAVSEILPSGSIFERTIPEGKAIIILKHIPLTTEQIELKAQLEARLKTAKAYYDLWRREQSKHGVDAKIDDTVAGFSTAMMRLEKKIAKYRCRNADELRMKIAFIRQCVDRNGWDYFDGSDMADAIMADALAVCAPLS